MAKRISIINFKGGVGKTTLAYHLGTGLSSDHSADVLLVDVDHQSSLSVMCLGDRRWTQMSNANRTVNEVFRSRGRTDELPGDEIIVKSPIEMVYSNDRNKRWEKYDSMDLVPACLELDDTEIALTRTSEGDPIWSEWNKRTLLSKWIEETGVDDEYDYIIFDCPPATKIVSQNAIVASHGYIVPVVPEAVAVRGLPHLVNLIETSVDDTLKALALVNRTDRRSVHVPDTLFVGVAITRIARSGRTASGYYVEHTRHKETLERRFGSKMMKPYILEGIGVPEASTLGVPVYARPNDQNIGRRGLDDQYRQLTREIVSRVDALT